MISSMHIVGMLLAVALTAGVSVYSGHAVKSASDFDSGGQKAGAMVVAGAIIGTLVGGSSTIGTAQLAYHYGLSAWWFTLGSGISCLILGLFFVTPFRRCGCGTILGILGREYGGKMDRLCAILSSVGMFVAILAQLTSSTTIFSIFFPDISTAAGMVLTALLMVCYVIFGGVMGTGMVGVVKLILLYITILSSGAMALSLSGGIQPLYAALDHGQYFNFFARGIGVDVGAGFSLLVGVLSTQTYYQAILSGRTDRAARQGALISACLIPPIGIGGILVGLYMRVEMPALETPLMALPLFVLEHMPPVLGGVIFATLLVTLIGTGAGLALGISSVLRREILRPLLRKSAHLADRLWVSRLSIVVLLALACLVCAAPIGDMVLIFSFLSMALRAAVIFTPLMCALFFPGRVPSRWAMAAAVTGPVVIGVLELFADLPFDPLFLGLLAAVLLCAVGAAVGRRAPR